MPIFKHLSLALFLTFTITSSFAQGKEDFTKKLFDIRLKYTAINKDKPYRLETIKDAETFLGHNTDNGASLTGYFKGDSLKKLVEWIGLSNKVLQNEYYFDKGKLFFVYATTSVYPINDSTQSFDYTKLNLQSSGRYYFDNEQLFDTILSDKQKNKMKSKDAAGFLASAKQYAKLLRAKLY